MQDYYDNPRYARRSYKLDDDANWISTVLIVWDDPVQHLLHPYNFRKWKPARSGSVLFFESLKKARNLK